jgi:type I restriction enzyme S subunit
MNQPEEHSVKLGRAFAVEFKDIERWDPASYHVIQWNWPSERMVRIGDLLTARKDKVDRKQWRFDQLQPVTVHNDGRISKRKVDEGRSYTMDLWFARPGDLLVAKIDLKNGAIAIVPDGWTNVAVTNHFVPFAIDRERVVPEYLHRVFQTAAFRDLLWRNKVGAEGRKEVKLDFFLEQRIPLPPLETQRRIVAHWQAGMQQAAVLEAQARKVVEEAQAEFLDALGIKAGGIRQVSGRAFALDWSDLSSWHGSSNLKRLAMGDVHHGRYPVMRGDECLLSISHGCSASPVTSPTGLEVLPISSVTKGFLDLIKRKYIPNRPALRDAYALRAGDVLMCRTNGTLAYVGMSALVDEDHPDLIFPDKVIRLRPKQDLRPDYLWLLLQTPPLRAQIEAAARTAVGNYAIGGKDIWNFEFPIPPVEVQLKLTEDVLNTRKASRALLAEAVALREKTVKGVEGMVMGTMQPWQHDR